MQFNEYIKKPSKIIIWLVGNRSIFLVKNNISGGYYWNKIILYLCYTYVIIYVSALQENINNILFIIRIFGEEK